MDIFVFVDHLLRILYHAFCSFIISGISFVVIVLMVTLLFLGDISLRISIFYVDYIFSTSTEKSVVESRFPHEGHMLEKPSITSFKDLSSLIFFINFPQLPHSTSSDKIRTNFKIKYNILE